MKNFPEYTNVKPSLLIKATLDILFPSEEAMVFEVRIPKTKYGTISGYFNDTAIAAMQIAKENGKHQSIYVTANPVDPALIARNFNKLEFGSHTTTSDAEIQKRRWFLIDLDPARPAGISSTDGELNLAIERAADIRDWMTSFGWPQPIEAISGNGAHLMFRADEPNDEETRAMFEYATKMLAGIWSDDRILVDTTMWNASRVWKVYGTVSSKGSDSPDRPHRVAMITKCPSILTVVPRALIENMAMPLRESKSEEFKDMTGEFIADMEKWLMDRGQTVTSGPRPLYGSEGKKWTISRCPFNSDHGNPMIGLVNNRPIYRCLHNSCSAFRWKEFREKIDPSYKDPDTIFLRLKEWCDGDSEVCDQELLESACRTGKKLDGIIKKLKKVCARIRVALLEEMLRIKRRDFLKETLGENNEKGNLVGVINKIKLLQAEGSTPTYWTCDYDGRVRAGTIGDIGADRLSETDEIKLLVKFHSMGDTWVRQVHIGQAIRLIASQYVVNPLRAYLKSYRWDGVKRLDTWLPEYAGTSDNEYTRAIGRKWLISAVARGIEPGCQADHMLILEGKQGIGKSQILRALGGAFYAEFVGSMSGQHSGHKDMVAMISGKLIVEMPEMATIKKADIEALKAILTATTDDVRLAYERDSKSYPRTNVFSATTNEVGQAYISDVSGARRFWPCVAGEVRPMKVELLKTVRDMLWAEAVDAFESGEDWWTVPMELTLAEQDARQASVEATDPWYAKVRASMTDPDSYVNQCFFAVEEFVKGVPSGKFAVRVGQMYQVLGMILSIDIERQSIADGNRLKNILRALGFTKIRPNKKWFDSSYAYQINEESAPHLWVAIQSAVRISKAGSFLYPETSPANDPDLPKNGDQL